MIKTYSYNKDRSVWLAPHFQVWEFRSYNETTKTLTTDKILIDEDLVKKLEDLYQILNKKYGLKSINITSAYRDSSFEKYLSGNTSSYHTKGMAADIMCYRKNGSLIDAKEICTILEDNKILGIGYIGNAVHIDTRSYKSYFDEVRGVFGINSFYDYFNIKKVSSTIYLENKGYNGVSIVDGLKGIGIDSSYSYRLKLAKINGINNYRGTAKQNTDMLNLLKEGKLIKS